LTNDRQQQPDDILSQRAADLIQRQVHLFES